MNVEIGTEAAQFPEKEYIHGFFLAVYYSFERDVMLFFYSLGSPEITFSQKNMVYETICRSWL